MREQKQNTIDQGWVAMQRVLDREMPQRRRRRIAGWWWLGSLFLLLAFVLAGWQLSQRANPTAPIAPAPALPAAPLAGRTPPAATLPSVHHAPETSKNAGEDPAFIKQARFNKRSDAHPYPLANQSFPVEKADAAVQETPQMLAPSTVIAASETIAAAEGREQTNTMTGDALALLPTLPPALEVAPTPRDFATYPDYTANLTKKLRHRASWELGVVASINSERLPRINGGTLGMLADWQPLRHWGLRSGLQYTMQRLAADESLVTTISEDAYERSSNGLSLLDGSGNYTYIGNYSSINTDILAAVRRIHRIEAPLLVYWQPGRAFRVYTGAMLHYTFLAQTSPRIFADNQVFKVATGHDELNRLATEKLNRWQVKWQLGVGYRLGRRVELGASIRAALPKISLRKDSHIAADLQVVADQNRISIEEVRQLGVSLRAAVFF